MSGQVPEISLDAAVQPVDITPTRAGSKAGAPVRRRRRSKYRPAWDEEPTRLGAAGKAVVLTFVVFAVVFPLYTVLLTSF